MVFAFIRMKVSVRSSVRVILSGHCLTPYRPSGRFRMEQPSLLQIRRAAFMVGLGVSLG